MKLLTPLFLVGLWCCTTAQAQDTLPKFSARDIGREKILISWTNPFPNCIQLAVQRSFDSTKYFTTIYSAVSPELPQNGFTDAKMPAGVKVYYRIFYVLEGGAYFFSVSKPIGTSNKPGAATLPVKEVPKVKDNKRYIKIYNRDKPTDVIELEISQYKKYKDSITTKTKDTIFTVSEDAVMLKPYIPKPTWKPSIYIYTNTKGSVDMHFPSVKQHKYKVVFYEEDGTELYTIKQVKEADLTIDYGNFPHAGWYHFDIYEDDKLKEKNKFQLQKLF
ncbi:hypothetical protein ACFOW1_16805 [Parasediminibacterium paludis]|uniref:Fibronectin type-III domain-containing protein n=1 Tax=Parasediminibacterium paludis TaxID=908966 RepID=A0ABV8Q2R7_9BACT